jgi:hypothetical protein
METRTQRRFHTPRSRLIVPDMVAVRSSGWKVAGLAAGCLGIAWGNGCVGFGGGGARSSRLSRPIVDFPSQESLSTIESQPAPMPSITTGEIPAAGWTLDAHEVALDPSEPFAPRTPWETAFAADTAQQRAQVRLTRSMSCVAREAGRFVLETRAAPPELLQQFLIAACGAVVPRVGIYWLSGEPPASASDDQVLAHWRAQIKNDLLVHLPADSTDSGFWYGRARGRAVAVMTYVANHVRWKTLGVVPDAQGGVTLEGELGEPSEYIIGYANQGRFNVEPCTFDPSVARPRFRASCHMAKDDTIGWVQLLSAPPKRVLAAPFAQILLRRTTDQALSFDMRPYSDPRPVKDAADFSNAIVTTLNAVRAQAGFRPVQLSIAESARATRLAAHFFADTLAADGGEKSDRIALGLLAGWQLEGLIRDGRFSASLSPHTHDAGQWLNTALSSPMGRAALMSPEIEALSLGTVVLSQPDSLGAVVTGYQLYHGDDHSADVRRLYSRLLAARTRLGLGMPARLGGMDRVLRLELERVKAGQRQSSQALQAVLDQGVSRFGAGMRGYVVETTSLEAFEIPEEIIRRPNLYFEIGVGHYRAPGAAWGQMVILVVFADPNHQAGQEI